MRLLVFWALSASAITNLLMAKMSLSICLLVVLAVSGAGAQAALPGRVCSYATISVLGPVNRNGFEPVLQLQGCGFAIADKEFFNLVSTSSPPVVVAQADYAFAHEAPVYLPALNKIFFTSNRLGNTSGTLQYTQLNTLDLATNKVTTLSSLTDALPLANGATNWPGTDDTIALLTQGKGSWQPGGVQKLNLRTLKFKTILDNYYGRPFNSPNDIVSYKDGKTLFFTDPPYGFAQNFKPAPELGAYLYAFNTETNISSVVADGFVKPNGVAFSPDYNRAYVTDTGMADGTGGPFNPANPQTVYAFDVVAPKSASNSGSFPTLRNRRTFAVADAGFPDGIKLDAKGNVYTGTGAGIEVFAPSGQRLGTILVDGGVANLVFAKKALYALNEKKIVSIKLKVEGAKLP